MFEGGYTSGFRSFRCAGKTRPRNVPALAQNCPKFNFDALARYPVLMPSTHTVFCTLLGLEGPRRKRGQNNPLFYYNLGGIPREPTKCMYYPLMTTFPALMTENILLFDQF